MFTSSDAAFDASLLMAYNIKRNNGLAEEPIKVFCKGRAQEDRFQIVARFATICGCGIGGLPLYQTCRGDAVISRRVS